MTYFKLVLILIFLLKSKCFYCQNFYDEGYKQYYQGFNNKETIGLFTKAIENNQIVAKSYMYRGSIKTFLGDFVGAFSDIDNSILLDSTDYKAYYYYGRIYFKQGFYENAIKYFNKAIFKNKKASEVYDYRAIAKSFNGDYKGALIDEDIAINLDPKSEYYNNRGFIKLNSQAYEESIKDFESALLNDSNNARAYVNKGMAFLGLKKNEDAIDFFTIAILKSPNSIDVYYYRGLAYKENEKLQLACADFEKSSQLGFELAKAEYNNCLGKK